MKIGAMQDQLSESLMDADQVFVYCDNLNWDIRKSLSVLNPKPLIYSNLDVLINSLISLANKGDIILIMSNGGFGGIHKKILSKLSD
jgi:UDP-N-acetylmuramate: L-alanyl-gamma-D-glutamyl-meso-diaminopimelate ligase